MFSCHHTSLVAISHWKFLIAPPLNLLGGRRRPSEQLEAFFLTTAMVLAFLVPILVHEAKDKFKIFFIPLEVWEFVEVGIVSLEDVMHFLQFQSM